MTKETCVGEMVILHLDHAEVESREWQRHDFHFDNVIDAFLSLFTFFCQIRKTLKIHDARPQVLQALTGALDENPERRVAFTCNGFSESQYAQMSEAVGNKRDKKIRILNHLDTFLKHHKGVLILF